MTPFWRHMRRTAYHVSFWPAWKRAAFTRSEARREHPNHLRAKQALDDIEARTVLFLRAAWRFKARRRKTIRALVWELRALRAARRESGI